MISTDHLVTIAQDPAETRPLPQTAQLPAEPAPAADDRPTHRLPPLTLSQQFAVQRRIWADRLVRGWPALLAGAALAALLLLVSLAPRLVATPAAAAPPAPTPPLAVPTAAPAGPTLPVTLAAYDAPAGRQLGELRAGLAYTVLAQAQAGAWLQLDAGSGPVWVEAAAWGASPVVRPAALADLTPPTPIPPTAVPLPPRVEVIYVAAPTAASVAELTPEAPGWHPPMAAGYNPAEGTSDCPLVLSPERLAACQAGRP